MESEKIPPGTKVFRTLTTDHDIASGGVTEVGEDKHGQYHRAISPRQIHMISLGGQIGAGLFINTGLNLRWGGPVGVFFGHAIVCSCVFAMLQTVSEMTIAFPVSGNFIDYADRFVDPALAFCAGISMWLGWTAIVAAEATFFLAVIVNYWAQGAINDAIWYTVFLAVMLIIFALPSRFFAWFEYGTSVLKIVALFIFMFAGFAMVLGAGPTGYVHHGETWLSGSALRNGFKGFANSTLLAVLAIGDNSFTGFLAGEAKSPRYSVGHAAFLVPIRVTIIYLLSIVFITLLVSPDNENLFGGSGIAASPFVFALNESGIPGLPEFLNVFILFAVSSIGAESIFVGSRMLRAMSHQKLIPEWVAAADAQGRPRWAVGITCVSAIALTYCNMSAEGIEVFTWLSNIASTGYFMVWVVVAITSFRFRAALKAQNDGLFTEPYAWPCSFWPLPPIWLLLCCSFYIASAIYFALYPVGSDTPTAYGFFQYLIGLMIIVFSGIGYKLILRTKMRDPSKVDLSTGWRPLCDEEIIDLDKYHGISAWRRFLSFIQLW
ncbi:unnamed protein product [Discula destructiva]